MKIKEISLKRLKLCVIADIKSPSKLNLWRVNRWLVRAINAGATYEEICICQIESEIEAFYHELLR